MTLSRTFVQLNLGGDGGWMNEQELPRIITSLSKLSFGMYLMHLFFLAPVASKLISLIPGSRWVIG